MTTFFVRDEQTLREQANHLQQTIDETRAEAGRYGDQDPWTQDTLRALRSELAGVQRALMALAMEGCPL